MIAPHVAVTLPGRTVYLQEPGTPAQMPTLRSFLTARPEEPGPGCRSIFTDDQPVFSALPVVDLNTLFTPPFSLR
jgi:hypothetical protein